VGTSAFTPSPFNTIRNKKAAMLPLSSRTASAVTGQQQRVTSWISTVLTARSWSLKELIRLLERSFVPVFASPRAHVFLNAIETPHQYG